MKQSKKVVARIIILILALFTVIPGTVSQKVYAEPAAVRAVRRQTHQKMIPIRRKRKKKKT